VPRLKYIERNFSKDNLAIIRTANDIIDEYSKSGFTLTLRQLYYQFVARGLIPNRQIYYNRLGGVINDARLAGEIDWLAIEDRSRFVRSLSHWDSPQDIVNVCAEQFRMDKWKTQMVHMEVWIEKDALIGVIEGICNQYDVPYFSCRGYVSQSEMWQAAQRFMATTLEGKYGILLYLGDHDPSGLDMTRDITDRFALFGADVEVRRLALSWDQILQYSPPPNPAKTSDSRFETYVKQFGTESWELDALDPHVLVDLVEREITAQINTKIWTKVRDLENKGKEQLRGVAQRWNQIKGLS